MTDEIPLGPGAEFDAIRALLARWGDRASGIGDDAALLAVPRGETLVASVDTAVEGVHFRREWLTARELGYRATVAALSDLAAMGARPLGILNAMTLTRPTTVELAEIADGIADAAAGARTTILGGNLSRGPALTITTTVLGAAYSVLARSAARPGDLVYVTGELGGPLGALRALEREGDAGSFRARFARPRARLDEARWLAERGARAAIDISDGIGADLRHLAAASRVALEIDARRIPCIPGVDLETALQSGEEYELVATAPTELDAGEFERRFALPLTRIGRVVDGGGDDVGSVRIDGERVANVRGHDHFSR